MKSGAAKASTVIYTQLPTNSSSKRGKNRESEGKAGGLTTNQFRSCGQPTVNGYEESLFDSLDVAKDRQEAECHAKSRRYVPVSSDNWRPLCRIFEKII